MKKLFIGIALLILVLAGGLAAAVWTLNSVDWSQYQEPIAAAVKEATGRELRFRGALNVRISLSPAVSARDIVLQNADWATGQNMLTLEQADVRLQLLPLIFGRIELARFELSGLDLQLETDRNGRGNWEFDKPGAAVGQPASDSAQAGFLQEAVLSQVLIRDATIVYRDAQTAQQQRIKVAEFNGRMASLDAPLSFDLQATYEDEPVALEGRLTGARDLLAGKPVAIELTANTLGANFMIDGRIGQPFEPAGIDVNLLATGQSMQRLLEYAEVDFPDPGVFRISANVSGDTAQADIRNLSVEVPALQMSGQLQIDLASKLMKLTGQLDASRIDLERLYPSEQAVGAQSGAASTGAGSAGESERLFPDEPLPVDIFASVATLDANIELSVNELIIDPETTVQNLQTRIQARPNLLLFKPLSLEMLGARMEGRLGLAPAAAGMDVQSEFAIRHPSIGDLVTDGDSHSLQGGPLNMEISINGAGESVRAIMAVANGYLRMELGSSQANSVWAQLAFAQVKALLDKDTRVPSANQPVEFNCLIADFSIDAGNARAVRLVADAKRLFFSGDGQINLGTEALALNIDWLAAGVKEKVRLPRLKIRGTLLAPSGKFDTKQLVGDTLGLGDGAVTLDDLDQAGVVYGTGPERCRQRLGVYQQISKERARPEQKTPESAIKDFKNVKKSIRDLKDLIKK